MAIITRTYTFTDGTTAYGSQVESEISGIVVALNALDAGTSTWTYVKATNSTITNLTLAGNLAAGNNKITGLAAATGNGEAVRYEQIVSAFIPAGLVAPYAAATAPTGWLLCDGTAVSRVTYVDLFTIIGTAHGTGDGATTFNLPDYRGRFLRMVDAGTARDPDAASRTAMATGGNTGNNVGSLQTGASIAHTHTATVTDPAHAHTERYATGGGASNGMVVSTTSQITNTESVNTTASNVTGITVSNSSTGGNETRPINAYVQYIIKY